MGRILKFKKGDNVGDNGVIYIRELPRDINKNNTPIRRCIFKCKCGKEFDARLACVRHGTIKSCGCLTNTGSKNKSYKHGLVNDKAYSLWKDIKTRCYNNNRDSYKYYGERGIVMYDQWINDFYAFYKYVINLPNYGRKGYSIDRINNNGNYEPGNIRFASTKEQVCNRSVIAKESGYIGVTKNKDKWVSRITHNGKIYRIGEFSSKEEAVTARDIFILESELDNLYEIQYIDKHDYKKNRAMLSM